jgi:hypothetical protein
LASTLKTCSPSPSTQRSKSRAVWGRTTLGRFRPILATQPAECRSRKRSLVVRSRATVGITSTAAR